MPYQSGFPYPRILYMREENGKTRKTSFAENSRKTRKTEESRGNYHFFATFASSFLECFSRREEISFFSPSGTPIITRLIISLPPFLDVLYPKDLV